jgi:hypothetical protein
MTFFWVPKTKEKRKKRRRLELGLHYGFDSFLGYNS